MCQRSTVIWCSCVVLSLLVAVVLAVILWRTSSAIASEPAAYPPPVGSPQAEYSPPAMPLQAYPGPATLEPDMLTPVPTIEPPTLAPSAALPTPAPTSPSEEWSHKLLEHIAAREGIPIEHLVVAGQARPQYKELGREFWAITVLDTVGDGWYYAMLDLADGTTIVDDIKAMDNAEGEARQAKYGVLQPALFERLQTLRPEDQVPVVIWVAGKPKRNEKEIIALLAARHPEVRAALEKSGNYLDVGDLELGMQLRREYVQELEADTKELTQPLVRYLEEKGHAVQDFGAMSAISATLPKAVILEVASRSDVGAIDLAGEKERPARDSAAPSDRVPSVWSRGYKGNVMHLAVLERGKVDFTSPPPVYHNYLHQGETRACAEGVGWHKTEVASVAASYHITATGVAPEAIVDDACTANSDVDTVQGLRWALDRTPLVNISAVFNSNPSLD